MVAHAVRGAAIIRTIHKLAHVAKVGLVAHATTDRVLEGTPTMARTICSTVLDRAIRCQHWRSALTTAKTVANAVGFARVISVARDLSVVW